MRLEFQGEKDRERREPAKLSQAHCSQLHSELQIHTKNFLVLEFVVLESMVEGIERGAIERIESGYQKALSEGDQERCLESG